jgi:hypothetical protein
MFTDDALMGEGQYIDKYSNKYLALSAHKGTFSNGELVG